MNIRVLRGAFIVALFSVFSGFAMELAPREPLSAQIVIINKTNKNYVLRGGYPSVAIARLAAGGKSGYIKVWIRPFADIRDIQAYRSRPFTINDPENIEKREDVEIYLHAMEPKNSSDVTFWVSVTNFAGADVVYDDEAQKIIIDKATLDKTSVVFYITLFEKDGELTVTADVLGEQK
jgi:hypothetical protein